MIGPSSGTGSVPKCEVTENPIRIKRIKVFEDLDIDNFCEDMYQGGRKRYKYMAELQAPNEGVSMQISNVNFSPMSAEEAADIGSVTRLEVLVVDGNWDTSELENATLTDLSQSHIIHSNGQIYTQINGEMVNQNFEGCQHFWEPPQISQAPPPKLSSSRDSSCQVPRFQENNPAEDQENGNLSWLLDFKLDSLIEAPDDKSTVIIPKNNQFGQKNKFQTNIRSGPSTSFSQDLKKVTSENSNPGLQRERNSSGPIPENRNVFRYSGPKKPPFTYTELIEQALQEKGELTVSAIYQWISEHFPYYKSNDDRWKNSVRHNLSINPHFRKGSKAPHGAGHLWAIANQDDSKSRHILHTYKPPVIESNNYREPGIYSQMITMDEVATATASITQPSDEEAENIINSVTLEHCAEQILSGIKREVEVQYLLPMVPPRNEQNSSQQNSGVQQLCPVKETDFLNPVSKEVVAEECGLIGEGYLVTDVTPSALGLNVVDPDIISADNLFGEELSFQYYEFASPSQMQSA